MALRRAVSLEHRDKVPDVFQMLAALRWRQAQRGLVHQLGAEGMSRDPVGRVWANEAAVPLAFGIEHHVGSEIALAEAGVADQTRRALAPKQLDQPFPELQTTSLAAVWAAADHHVAGWRRSFSVC
jgi:hypothetical protein